MGYSHAPSYYLITAHIACISFYCCIIMIITIIIIVITYNNNNVFIHLIQYISNVT